VTDDASRLQPVAYDPDDVARWLASPLGRFKPWVDPNTGASPQRDFLRAAQVTRARTYRGGNQTGKTTIGMAVEPLLRALGRHPFAHHRPPVHGWISALDWEWGIGQVIWPAMRQFMPWDQVRSVLWYRRAEPEMPAALVFKNGSQIDFKSAESGRRKYQGAPLHFVGVDEEHPSDVIEECRARLLKHGGEFWATLTPVRRERWVLELEREQGTVVVRASSRAAARAGILDEKAVASYADSLPGRQAAVRIEGDFAPLSGLVYPAFARDVHVLRPKGDTLVNGDGKVVAPWPIPSTWSRYAAMDFGYGVPSSVVICALEPVRRAMIVERVLYASGIRASRWGEILTANGPDRVMPPLRAAVVCDHDLMERMELEAKGVRTRPAMKEVVPGLETVERALHVQPDGLPMLWFVLDDARPPRHPMLGRIDAHSLVWELEGYRYPEARNETAPDKKDLPLKRDDHACDALRYLVVFVVRESAGGRAPTLLALTSKTSAARDGLISDLRGREEPASIPDRLMGGDTLGGPRPKKGRIPW
jgi:phage terminase large subunit-like protein